MKTKLSILIALVLALSFSLVTAVPVSAAGTPEIDGVISVGEWDGAVEFVGTDYSVYVLNDTEYLYIGFEAQAGDYTIPSSMTNIYIYAGDDYAGECWAYCVNNAGNLELVHFTTHHIQAPKVKEGREVWPTNAIVSIAPTVMEWQIPLAEFPMGPGDPLAFDFMSFSEGSSAWATAWLYEQEYTLAPPPPIEVNIDIKPGSDPNSINLGSKGVVPVAVLTTDDFDASTVDAATVEFAGALLVRSTECDVDGDGDLDMLFRFKTQDLNLTENSTEAFLDGMTYDGLLIWGRDTVNIVPKGR